MKHEQYERACVFLQSLSKLQTPFEYMKDRSDLHVYLERMQDLLDRLGNPERDLKYIHVTGTAGKGTTVSLLHNMLNKAGYIVGSTLSPATSTTLERIRVNDNLIYPETLAALVEKIKPVITEMYLDSRYGKPSYFDIMLAIALMYFKDQDCQWVVLEVGMGGRYDSTNVIPSPAITAITNISKDHTHLLGDTLQEIAYEKAGIIKTDSVFFTTEPNHELREIFQEICKSQHVQYQYVGGGTNEELVRAIGRYLNIENKQIDWAIETLNLPCRFEIMENKPLVILDGAHNLAKMEYTLAKLKRESYKNLHVVFGCGETKDGIGMIDLIALDAASIVLTLPSQFPGKSFSIKLLFEHLRVKYPKINVSVELEPHVAFKMAQQSAQSNDVVFVTGSLYLAGDIRTQWFHESEIISQQTSFPMKK